ncbi:MAG: response regulator transcription factor [Campylobacteraceae bacterium]|nr:response regulator transcription factor [Campylobacteraceae bacterium]
MKVLLVEDDTQLNTTISSYLETIPFEVLSVEDGEDAIDIIDKNIIDLYLIDINIPSISGLDLLKYIRQTNIHVPIIIITASLEINNLTDAFDNGCNEYLKKPFHLKELEVRINKLINVNLSSIQFSDNFYYCQNKKSFIVDDVIIELRKKEDRFLGILMDNIGKTVDTQRIIDYVWENEIKDKYPIRQLLNGIRKKLPVDIIKTQIGVGYKIEN